MIGVIVSGHGNFATGITSALNLILGEQKEYLAIDFLEKDTLTELEKKIESAIVSLKDCNQIVIFCDLLSGSPFNVSIMKALQDSRIKVIHGVNLGMLIESMMNRNMGMEFEKIIDVALELGKSQIGLFVENKYTEDDSFE